MTLASKKLMCLMNRLGRSPFIDFYGAQNHAYLL